MVCAEASTTEEPGAGKLHVRIRGGVPGNRRPYAGYRHQLIKGTPMDPTRTELKITIAKLIEVAYSKDKGLTTKIVREKGPFKLTVDQDGQAGLSSKFGIVNFSGSDALDKIGANIKSISVNFSNHGGDKIKYTAIIDIKAAKMAISGDFDIEALITSCSGLLCQAARALKGRHHVYDMELQRIMGY